MKLVHALAVDEWGTFGTARGLIPIVTAHSSADQWPVYQSSYCYNRLLFCGFNVLIKGLTSEAVMLCLNILKSRIYSNSCSQGRYISTMTRQAVVKILFLGWTLLSKKSKAFPPAYRHAEHDADLVHTFLLQEVVVGMYMVDQKAGLFLRSDNFATSNVLDVCLK